MRTTLFENDYVIISYCSWPQLVGIRVLVSCLALPFCILSDENTFLTKKNLFRQCPDKDKKQKKYFLSNINCKMGFSLTNKHYKNVSCYTNSRSLFYKFLLYSCQTCETLSLYELMMSPSVLPFHLSLRRKQRF